jgi:glyoxylase-like metal-dependent hydrolase (beta-lactamase superfamily II)
VVPAFLVEHPSLGPILVDTGFDKSVATNKAENLGRLGAAIYNVKMKPEEAIPDQLRDRGVDPRDVRHVVMTHLHFDHASGVSQFPAATFVVAALEWAEATGRGATFKGFRKEHVDHDYGWRTIDWAASYVEGHATFGRSVDLFGDGSIRLLHTPGHTPGHQSILLRLEGRSLLLTGDAAYAIATIDGDLVPIFVDDMHDYRRSLAEIRNFRRQDPEAVVICGHDADNWPGLQAAYA